MLTNINKRVNLNFVAKDPNFLNAECKVRSTFQRIMIDFNCQSM